MNVFAFSILTWIYHVSFVLTYNHDYFKYEYDCSTECVSRNESCTIAEPSALTFVRNCYTNDAACIAEASPIEVCLTAKGKPIGGSLIWRDYRKRFYPEKPHSKLYMYVLIGVVIFIVGTTTGCLTQQYFSRYVIRRRNNYTPIPPDNSVYQSTVEPVAYDGRDEEENRYATDRRSSRPTNRVTSDEVQPAST